MREGRARRNVGEKWKGKKIGEWIKGGSRKGERKGGWVGEGGRAGGWVAEGSSGSVCCGE